VDKRLYAIKKIPLDPHDKETNKKIRREVTTISRMIHKVMHALGISITSSRLRFVQYKTQCCCMYQRFVRFVFENSAYCLTCTHHYKTIWYRKILCCG
jgi:hypothetical protein